MTRLDEARMAIEAHRANVPGTTAPSLFDAELAAGEAIARVEDSHRGELIAKVDKVIGDLAARYPEFTADDVREHLGNVADQVDLRVVGVALRGAARRKLISSAAYVPSRYRHASPIRLWRSELWDGA